MNLNNFTIKSQEALQQAQLSQGNEQQQIENEHLLKAIFEVDENVAPFILKKLNVNVPLFKQILDSEIQSFPKFRAQVMFQERQIVHSMKPKSSPKNERRICFD
jgi:ATP-dependent Clp protease ATP-binding subunit ClpA